MYAPNEYYRPYNPRAGRAGGPRDRQRVPPSLLTGQEKPPAFQLLETPPPPSSLHHSSQLTTDSLLAGERDRTECHCRISAAFKAVIFLLVLVAATAGLAVWFLTGSSGGQEADLHITATHTAASGQNTVRDINEAAEKFPSVEGEAAGISPTPSRPPAPAVPAAPAGTGADIGTRSESAQEKEDVIRTDNVSDVSSLLNSEIFENNSEDPKQLTEDTAAPGQDTVNDNGIANSQALDKDSDLVQTPKFQQTTLVAKMADTSAMFSTLSKDLGRSDGSKQSLDSVLTSSFIENFPDTTATKLGELEN